MPMPIFYLSEGATCLVTTPAKAYKLQGTVTKFYEGTDTQRCEVCEEWDSKESVRPSWLPSQGHIKGTNVFISYWKAENKLVLGVPS